MELGKLQVKYAEGLTLLTFSLLLNNTGAVVLSTWVPYDRTHHWMVRNFFGDIQPQKRLEIVLNQAREKILKSKIEVEVGSQFDDALTYREMMEFGRNKQFISCAHPYFWAGYRLYGFHSP